MRLEMYFYLKMYCYLSINLMCHLFFRCPNPLDSGNTSILYMKDLPQNRHQRRFEIKAFQFMDLSTNKYLNEEVT